MPSTADVLRRNRLRADSIRQRLNGTAGANKRGDATVPTTLGSSLDTLEYVVTVGLGTPAVTQTVVMDTGSDLSWVQRRPCPAATCHPQKDRLFDPARSATYSAFGCRSAACRALLGRDLYGNGCSRRGRCQYAVRYGDGSNTTGTYGADKLTLTPAHAVDGFRFGCSHAAPLFSDRAEAPGPRRRPDVARVAGGGEGLLVLPPADGELLRVLDARRAPARRLVAVRGSR